MFRTDNGKDKIPLNLFYFLKTQLATREMLSRRIRLENLW